LSSDCKSFRADSIAWRVRSFSAGMSDGVSPSVVIGSRTRAIARARRNRNECFAMQLRVPATAIGRIGEPVSIASLNAPSLNGRRSPVGERVPSGKIMMLTCLRSRSRHSASACIVLSRLPRLTGMSPAIRMCQPITGILKSVSFDSHFISHGK